MNGALLFIIFWVSLANAHAEAPVTADLSTPTPAPKINYAVTAAIAFPQPLTLGVQAHSRDAPDFDVFYEAGFFKYPLTSSDRSFSDYTLEAGVRFHPFHNWFFTSAELGFHHIGVQVDLSNVKQDGVALAQSATLSMGTFFLGLLIGGEWKLTQHLSFAFDLGVQIALIHTGSINISAFPGQSDAGDLSVDDSLVMSRVSGLPLPQIAIFRFLWYI